LKSYQYNSFFAFLDAVTGLTSSESHFQSSSMPV